MRSPGPGEARSDRRNRPVDRPDLVVDAYGREDIAGGEVEACFRGFPGRLDPARLQLILEKSLRVLYVQYALFRPGLALPRMLWSSSAWQGGPQVCVAIAAVVADHRLAGVGVAAALRCRFKSIARPFGCLGSPRPTLSPPASVWLSLPMPRRRPPAICPSRVWSSASWPSSCSLSSFRSCSS